MKDGLEAIRKPMGNSIRAGRMTGMTRPGSGREDKHVTARHACQDTVTLLQTPRFVRAQRLVPFSLAVCPLSVDGSLSIPYTFLIVQTTTVSIDDRLAL